MNSYTLILVAYNHEAFIHDAVMAALRQECPPMEIIISDDASVDGTFAIMEECVRHYRETGGKHSIILNRNENNLGLTKHLEKVVSMADGNWFIMAGGDDISKPFRCAEIMKAVEENSDAWGIVGDLEVIDVHNRIIGRESGWPISKKHPASQPWFRQFGKTCYIVPTGAAAAWRKEIYTLFSPPADQLCSEDLLFAARCHFLNKKIVRVPKEIIQWRHHDRNLSAPGLTQDVGQYERELIRVNRLVQSSLELVVKDLESLGREKVSHFEEIRTYLNLLIRQCDELIRWWDVSHTRRFLWFLDSPRTWGFDITVRMWRRLLPQKWYFAYKARRQRYSRF